MGTFLFGIKSVTWSTIQKLHKYSFSIPWDWNSAQFALLAAVFELRVDFIGYSVWNLNKGKKWVLSFFPRRSKWSLLSLKGQPFSRYSPIFKRNFHFWAWKLEFGERTKGYTCNLSLPQGVEFELILILQAAVFEIRVDFQKLGMKSGIWRKVQTLHMYSLSTPGGRN